MASTTMIETVTITRPLKPHKCSESRQSISCWRQPSYVYRVRSEMHSQGNFTASYLWQPAELARRVLGERPSSVPPTREMWPTTGPLAISTVHVAYLQDEPLPLQTRRVRTLAPPPPPPGQPELIPCQRPRLCSVGTNTEAPVSPITRLKSFFKKQRTQESTPEILDLSGSRLTAVRPEYSSADPPEPPNAGRRAIGNIRKALAGTKHRITPGRESPKIVYDDPKPGDRIREAFGTRKSRWSWIKIPEVKFDCKPKIPSWKKGRCFGGRYRPNSRTPSAFPAALSVQMTQV